MALRVVGDALAVGEPPARTPGTGRGLGAYVIRPRDVRPGWLLYAGTFFLQLFCGAFRAWVVSYPVLRLAFTIIG